jgi:hypothetical protein
VLQWREREREKLFLWWPPSDSERYGVASYLQTFQIRPCPVNILMSLYICLLRGLVMSIIRRFGVVGKDTNKLRHVVPSVLSARINVAPSGRFPVKSDTAALYESLSRISKFFKTRKEYRAIYMKI